METESSSTKLMEANSPKSPGRRRRCICLSATAAALLALGLLLLLILGLTVFKARRPTTRVDSVALDDLDFSVDLARLRVVVNVSLAIGITIHNPNRVGFKYHNGTALLRHRGNEIGEVPVPAGRIGERDTRSLNLTLALMADRIVSDSTLFNDVVSGTLPIQAYVKLSGKVRIVLSIHVATYSTCDVDVILTNRTLSNLKCHYRTNI
ncbi:hypothetical protein SASPL_101897 [Salvia splendens]|uniref:Late embryogenesis abundant protein LEA-2 subgroup domain-containing protein n=1 Tax=Salvia splendens TaxID=180675 RepID=A0A8X8YSK5_SALSN|nr:uncharacterized protein LOC121765360 [Salvia splendens]KAG6436990.1 hypothetical protein SASPL_101897 [Salvia splendens]